MKNKFSLGVLVLLTLLLTGCSNTPTCDGESEIKILKSIFKDEFSKNEKDYTKSLQYVFGGEINFKEFEKKFDAFLENEVVIELARPTEIDKELNSCKCQATLKLKFSNDWWKTLLENMEEPTEYNITYSLQGVNDNIIAETDLKLVTKIINIFFSGIAMDELGEDPTLEH